jgi:hypothetical protein
MNMTKRTLTSRAVTINDYYSERFLRIETELKHQRELMKLGFEAMEKRFEAADKRAEDLRSDINTRFEAADKHIEGLRTDMNARFESSDSRMDRFMRWSFGMTLTCTGLIIAAMKLWK